MRWIVSGLFLLNFLTSQAKSFNCFLFGTPTKNELNIKYTKKAKPFKEPMEYAASHFPELKGVTVEVRRKHIGTMMAARPRMDFIFKKKQKRHYVIYITDCPGMNAGVIFDEMSECAKTGVLGHELSHILTYEQKNNMQLLWFGVAYLFNKKKIEEDTDKIAIEHGFADELLEYTKYIHNSPHTNRKYLRKKQRNYLSVNEMKQVILNAM